MVSKNHIVRSLKESRLAYLFVAPLFIGLAIFSYYPAFSSIYHSFFDWDMLNKEVFIGIQNYKNLFKDPIFLNSIPAMFKLMIPRLLISIIVPLIMAEMIIYIRSQKLQAFYRMAILLPMVAPGVVGTLLWKYIYDPSQGLAVEIVRLLGIVDKNVNIDWLGDPKLVIGSIIFMGFPWIGGTSVLIYLSGLMDISGEIREACVLDGANNFQKIIHIDMPLITGQIRYFLVFGIINGLQDYGVQMILTKGGPGYETYVPGYYMYKQAFTSGNMGYACTIGTVLFVIIMLFTLLTMRFVKSRN